MPLVLRKEGLLECRAGGVFGLALLLPVVDLGLFTGERTLVVLEVVGLGVVSLDAVKEKIAVLLQDGVNVERQVVEVGGENGRLSERAGFQSGQRWGEIRGSRGAGGLELVDERGDQVRVVDLDRQFNEDVLVSQVGLLQPVVCISRVLWGGIEKGEFDALFRSELVLLERSQELRRQTERLETQATLSAAADIVHKSDCPLIHFLLVKELVLDHVHVDKVTHVGTRVPADIVRIDVNFPKHADHLSLVGNIGLRTRSGGGRVRRSIVKVRLRGQIDDGEGEAVGDFQDTSDIHTNDRASCGSRELLGAVLDDFHGHLDR